jgi:DNA-directed RNA polymerase sigma subunit (sigma70/sigma32)
MTTTEVQAPEHLQGLCSAEHYDERLAYVVRRRGEGATLEAIGAELDITRERVRQLRNRARQQGTEVA